MDQNTVNPAVGTVETAEITETSGQAETGKSGRPKKQKTVEMPRILTVSPAPFVKSPETVSTMMLDVIIALIPALLWGIYVFGFRAAAIAMVSVGSAVLSEAVMRFLLKRSVTIGDLSAAVTGLLLAMLMPVSVPLWIPAVGSCFAIVIVKQLFGGIGNNFVNPALTAWVFLGFFGDHLSAYTMPGEKINSFAMTLAEEELAAAADPLLALKAGHLPESNLFDMMIGNVPGGIGEVSSLLLIAGGIYLLWRRVITWHIPAAFIGTVVLVTFVLPQYSGIALDYMLYQLFAGGLILGAFFMATDTATSPVTRLGKLVYGIGCGLLTVVIRYFCDPAEGMHYAILVMNLLAWPIEKLTMPRRFGGK